VEAVLKDNTIKQSWIILICLVWITAVSCNPNISPTPAAIEPLTTARATATHIQTPTPTISIPTQTPTAENMTLIVTPTESSVTSTPTERQHHTIIPIEDLSCPIGNEQLTAEGIPSSLDMQWSDDGQSLIYGRSNTQGPSYVQFLPYYQSWWQYNVESVSPMQSGNRWEFVLSIHLKQPPTLAYLHFKNPQSVIVSFTHPVH
jgi:hypothetical protein